ncbi:MAG TPA: hypothetical protein VM536_01030, partial [Chloroflexia bacterium]|nr:hypothetical protein [Chloroflexia bacterium]
GDMLLELEYQDVQRYSLSASIGDWRYDEVRYTDASTVVHELELVSGTYWLIECTDIVTSHTAV